jgi:hypothetical protein
VPELLPNEGWAWSWECLLKLQLLGTFTTSPESTTRPVLRKQIPRPRDLFGVIFVVVGCIYGDLMFLSFAGEHEIDYILILKGLEENHVLPNQNEVAETRFVSRSELADFLSEHKNQLTPWFSLIAHTFLPLWWDQLSNLNALEDIKDTIHKF